MKIILVLLVANLFEANPCKDVIHITPEKLFSGKETITIQQGTPLTDEQEPIIVFNEKQWLSLSDKSECSISIITRTTQQHVANHFGRLDLNSGHYPISQLSGFVQARPQVAGAQ
ncbi:MAG: hypothetical protein WCO66_03565 [Candidatus Absconditabacteria bacterium]